jgi:hypothetical protein
MNHGPSILDGWRALIAHPTFRRRLRLALAILAALAAVGYFIAQGWRSPNAILLCLVAVAFAVWFVRSPMGEGPLPAFAGSEAVEREVSLPPALPQPPPAQPAAAPNWGARLRLPIALLLALVAQIILDLRPAGYERSPAQGAILYGMALAVALTALVKGDVHWLEPPPTSRDGLRWRPSLVSVVLAWAGFGFGVATFASMEAHLFTSRNVALWGAAFVCWLIALTPAASEGVLGVWARMRNAAADFTAAVRRCGAGMHLSGWSLLVASAFVVGVTVAWCADRPRRDDDHASS